MRRQVGSSELPDGSPTDLVPLLMIKEQRPEDDSVEHLIVHFSQKLIPSHSEAFKFLGIPDTSNMEQIKQAYHKLVEEWDPNRRLCGPLQLEISRITSTKDKYFAMAKSHLIQFAFRMLRGPLCGPSSDKKEDFKTLIADYEKDFGLNGNKHPRDGKIFDTRDIFGPDPEHQAKKDFLKSKFRHDGFGYPKFKKIQYIEAYRKDRHGNIKYDFKTRAEYDRYMATTNPTLAQRPEVRGMTHLLGEVIQKKMPNLNLDKWGVIHRIAMFAVEIENPYYIDFFGFGKPLHIDDFNKILKANDIGDMDELEEGYEDSDDENTYGNVKFVELDRSKFMEVPLRLVPNKENFHMRPKKIKNAIVVRSEHVISTETHHLLVFPAWTQDTCESSSVNEHDGDFIRNSYFAEEPYLLAEVRDLGNIIQYRYNQRGELCGNTFKVFVKRNTWDPKHYWFRFEKPEVQASFDIKSKTFIPESLSVLQGTKHTLGYIISGVTEQRCEDEVVRFNLKDDENVLFDTIGGYYTGCQGDPEGPRPIYTTSIPRSIFEALVKKDPRRFLTLERAMRYFSIRDENDKKAYLNTISPHKRYLRSEKHPIYKAYLDTLMTDEDKKHFVETAKSFKQDFFLLFF